MLKLEKAMDHPLIETESRILVTFGESAPRCRETDVQFRAISTSLLLRLLRQRCATGSEVRRN
jgi:hypothetical protein